LGVIHKDIKPGNLLVTLDDTLKISDFGVAEMLDRFDRDDWCTVAQGTPKFQPPEIVSGIVTRYHGRKVDIWACGVTLYNLVSGEYPFEGDVIMRLFENIATQPLQMPHSVQLSEPLKNLLTAMLEKDPEKRMNMHDIRRCDWYKQKYLPDESLRVAVPVCNNMPAHRPLSVYAPLEQMYGGAMEEGATSQIAEESMGDGPRVVAFPAEDEEMLLPADTRNNDIVVPLNESKRNRSMTSASQLNHPRSRESEAVTGVFKDESLRVAVPVCNNMPAHRPLSVYAPLEQMYGGAMEEGATSQIAEESMGDGPRVVAFPAEDEEMLLPADTRNNDIVVPLNESKRNRSILSMCMGSSRSP
ncbi:Serine/threonine-protein kinase par-4, partial [Toxocara canis]